ncbi:hypothetical protein Lal_00027115 [Lupinus albus]|nr:hypothetical protein Lal_00027115 [Lupinus albus]
MCLGGEERFEELSTLRVEKEAGEEDVEKGICPEADGIRRISYHLGSLQREVSPKEEGSGVLAVRARRPIGGEYATKFEELAIYCPYYELEVDGQSKCAKFESSLKPKLKMMFG